MNIYLSLALIMVSAVMSGYLVYFFLRPQIKDIHTYNKNIEIQNKQILEENKKIITKNQELLNQNKQLSDENIQLVHEKETLTIQKEATQEQIDNLHSNLQTMETQAQEAADLFYKSKMKVAIENFERSLIEESEKYQNNLDEFQKQYEETVLEFLEQYKVYEANLAQMKATNDSAVAAAKRAEEIKTQADFYRIQLSEQDIKEIELLRSVEPYLRDKEPLNKVIWKCYYEKPTTDMIGRVLGSGTHTGIYKITEIATGKCYVGQAANLSDRWKQHIKRGVGADTPTRNKLYPAMNAAGPENFTFEMIEECERSLLDEREDFWQDYFKAREYGFSIK